MPGSSTLGELELSSFDELTLGGEWTTRRRTISDSEIALFAAVAGDFSPLTVDSSNGPRQAPPALVLALAAGLASMDMPIPQISAWEWQSWKFPKPVRAGDTIYARWTLTQKRAPVGSARTAIAVWRVDVHTVDGAVCAEGEVGASVFRSDRPAEAAAASGTSRRRRRRRPAAAEVAPPPPPPQPAAPPKERASGSRRRRRRRTSSGGGAPNNGEAPAAPAVAEAPPPIIEASAAPTSRPEANPLSRVMKRLRRS